MSEAARREGGGSKSALVPVPLVPPHFRWVLIVEVLLVLLPLVYIFAGWRANG